MKNKAARAPELQPIGAVVVIPLRLDFGCGRTKLDGWEGIDSIDFGQKHVLNIAEQSKAWYRQNHEFMTGDRETPPDVPRYLAWPFADGSVDEVRSSHFVEHLTGEQRVFFFSELYRVMKVGATAQIVTPNWSHSCAYGDPTHQWPPMSSWFTLYLNEQWRAVNAPHAGFACDFDWGIAGGWDASIEMRNAETKAVMMDKNTNCFRDLIATLTKRPPSAPAP